MVRQLMKQLRWALVMLKQMRYQSKIPSSPTDH
jgi:hypothetical protein